MGAARSAEIRLFGGVQAVGRSGTTSFAGAKQRAIVARLGLEPGVVVSIEHLIDGIWGDDPPATVRAALQVHVSQIRKALADVGLEGVLITKPAGYRLDVLADQVDVNQFERLAATTDVSADPGDALDCAHAALRLWRGEPLVDVQSAPFAGPASTKLHAALTNLLCHATDAALSTGRQTEVLTEVEAAAAANPYHERLWVSAARLLYAVDRQADALERLRTLRRTLRDELGLEPATAVTETESRILNHDASLSPTRTTAPSIAALTRTKLPPVRSLIGRDDLVARAIRSLSEGGGVPSVVTLIGPAGVGKTSIAVQSATRSASRYSEGACFVDLSTLETNVPVWLAVAAALGLRPSTPDDARQELHDLLKNREQLLVFDNCEHVIGSVVDLIESLSPDSRVTILATSRSPLGVADECVIRVDPLGDDDLAEVFIRRARAADMSFDADDRDAVHQVVASLGGLPLAAELAAPLVRTMTTRELAATLERSGGHAAPRWSMRDSIRFSVDLLGAPARTLFARLSVFPAGTGMDGIERVCGDPGGDPAFIGESAIGDLVAALVDASLLVADRTPDGTWYRMLNPIRAVAAEMAVHDAATDLRQRHAVYVIDEVARLSQLVEGPDPRVGLEGIERQAANIRHAWAGLRRTDPTRLKLLAAFSPFAIISSSSLPELSGWIAEALDELEVGTVVVDDTLRLRVMLNAALLVSSGYQASESLVRRVIELAQEVGDSYGVVIGAALLNDLTAGMDNLVAAERAIDTIAAAQGVGSGALTGFAIAYAVNPMLRVRDHIAARDVLEHACAIDTASYGVLEALVLCQAARLALAEGDFDRADNFYRRAEQSAHRTGAALALSFTLFGRAKLARVRGRDREALEHMQRSAALTLIVQPNQVYQECIQLAMIGCDLGDEAAVVDAASLLGAANRPYEQLAEHVVRGCLALVRDLQNAARDHLETALELCAATSYVTVFAEVAEYWARTLDPPKRASTRRVMANVDSGALHLHEALTSLRELAVEIKSSATHDPRAP